MPRTSSASRARRIRRIGLLGVLLTTLLTPAGIIVSTVTAAALIGGAFHLSRAEPETAVTPPHPVTVKTGSPQHLNIGRDGKTVALVIAEDTPGQGSGAGSFDPANPLFVGIGGNGPTQSDTPGGTPSGRSMPAGSADHGSGGPDETPNEAGGPQKSDEKPIQPPPTVNPDPDPDKQPPEKESDLPLDTLPGLPTTPLTHTPPDTQTAPPGKQLTTQPNAVPEPSMLGLLLLGVAALAWNGRRRPDALSAV
ncbi:MAG: PEP-CTERM sorting domain-containing protein [Gammaproteobacteria bacterium]